MDMDTMDLVDLMDLMDNGHFTSSIVHYAKGNTYLEDWLCSNKI